ncbi:MAG: flagellar FlbD family protein [Acidimicrobiales bacterium]
MIALTRLDGSRFWLNEDRIERIEEHPDTTLTTADGNRYTVHETVEEVVGAIRQFRADVFALAATAGPPSEPEPGRRLRTIEGGGGQP